MATKLPLLIRGERVGVLRRPGEERLGHLRVEAGRVGDAPPAEGESPAEPRARHEPPVPADDELLDTSPVRAPSWRAAIRAPTTNGVRPDAVSPSTKSPAAWAGCMDIGGRYYYFRCLYT